MAIIDGDEGLVILDPDRETQERYRKLAAERSARFQVLTQQADLPAETLDGTRIDLWANIEFGGEVEACLDRGAVGVGLFRTEFLFLNAETTPTEDEQFEVYAVGRPLDARPADRDQDARPGRRQAAGLPDRADSANPTRLWVCAACGFRCVIPVLFRPQLRALLRASTLGDRSYSVSPGFDPGRTARRAGRPR